ncbi:MAG: hypothetical protein RLO50_10315 [Azospirillaceae bacterium]
MADDDKPTQPDESGSTVANVGSRKIKVSGGTATIGLHGKGDLVTLEAQPDKRAFVMNQRGRELMEAISNADEDTLRLLAYTGFTANDYDRESVQAVVQMIRAEREQQVDRRRTTRDKWFDRGWTADMIVLGLIGGAVFG